MRRIAFRGLLGRRRDAALLWSVVVLAFLFLTLSTTLITSLQATDAAQRVSTYGSWQVMAAGLTREEGERLVQEAQSGVVLPMIPVSGTDYFAGDNSYFLTTYSPELAELGQFRLREGRWPETGGEVVLEYARMAALDLQVGDTLAVSCTIQLPMTEEFLQQRWAGYDAAVEEATAGYREQALEIFRSGTEWKIGDEGLWIGDTLYPPTGFGQGFSYSYPQNFPVPLGVFSYLRINNHVSSSADELTEEEFLSALDNYFRSYTNLCPKGYKEQNLLGHEGLSIRMSYEAVDPKGDDFMTLSIAGKYTICGVLETYVDRWDSGELDLPGGFFTQEDYRLLLEAQQSARDVYPGFEGADFDTMALLRVGEDASARELWQEFLPIYNPIVDENAGESIMIRRQPYTDPKDLVEVEIDGEIHYIALNPAKYRETFLFQLWNGVDGETVYATAYVADAGEDGALLALGQPEPWLFSFNGNGDGPAVPVAVIEMKGWGFSQTEAITKEGWYSVPLEEFLAGDFTVEGMRLLSDRHAWPQEIDWQHDYSTPRINRFSYPLEEDGSESLLALVTGILFVTTVCAVCQICFTQIRRRLRRIVLLKSVGAETGQIAAMLGWEFLYLWLASLPVGTALGLGGARLALQALGRSRGKEMLLTLRPSVLLAALAAGTLALALGMCVPMGMAVGVPLTGRSTRKKPLPLPKKETKQDFFHVTLRGYAAKKGRMAGSFALCAFMMTILVLCLFLSFRFLGPYRETVERDNKPDYWLRSPYAMSLRQREEYLQELEELGFCEEIQTYFTGEDINLPYSDWESSPLLTAAARYAEDETKNCPVNLYAIQSTDPLFAQYSAAVTVGSLDPTAFDAGEQVLLMIPLYRDTDGQTAQGWLAGQGIDTSYYAEYDGIYSRDTAVRVGDTLSLWIATSSIAGEGIRRSTQTAHVTVGAILYCFPGQGIWPVSSSGEGYQVVTSLNLLRKLLPQAGSSMGINSVRAVRNQVRGMSLIDSAYGVTDFYIKAREDADLDEMDTALLIFARGHCMEFEIYHESIEKILQDAINNILLVCLLGLTAVLLALMIFFNTVASDLEQERRRLGILQSLGVSNGKLVLRQLCLGLVCAGGALVIANLLLWGGVALYAGVGGKVLGNLLWGYPVAGHILLCLCMAAALVLLYVLPILGLCRYLPIDNIRSRK